MDDLSAQRTLVKSPPELWAEISDIESLARRLGEFGEIRITQLEPETTVAWEGDRIRGTVTLKPSGWGTKVTLAAELDEIVAEVAEVVVEEEVVVVEDVVVDEPVVEAAPEVEPEAESVVEAEPEVVAEEPVKVGFFKRLFGRKAKGAEEPEAVVVEPEPEPEPIVVEPEPEPVLVVEPEPEPEPEPVVVAGEPEPAMDGAAAQAVLVKVLDDLGAAHHRPFSRG